MLEQSLDLAGAQLKPASPCIPAPGRTSPRPTENAAVQSTHAGTIPFPEPARRGGKTEDSGRFSSILFVIKYILLFIFDEFRDDFPARKTMLIELRRRAPWTARERKSMTGRLRPP